MSGCCGVSAKHGFRSSTRLPLAEVRLRCCLLRPSLNNAPLFAVLNRFSSDQYSIDDLLPFSANILLATVVRDASDSAFAHYLLLTQFGLLGTAAVLIYSTPLLSLCFLPLGVLYYLVQVRLQRWWLPWVFCLVDLTSCLPCSGCIVPQAGRSSVLTALAALLCMPISVSPLLV
jgi:hypothetical protein